MNGKLNNISKAPYAKNACGAFFSAKVYYFTNKDFVKQLWKTMWKQLKSYIMVTVFAENSVENVKDVKTLTCFNIIFRNEL